MFKLKHIVIALLICLMPAIATAGTYFPLVFNSSVSPPRYEQLQTGDSIKLQILGSTQCLQVNTSGTVSGAGNSSCLPSIASGDILANLTGSSAIPVASTLTAAIDFSLCSTNGDVLGRTAGIWGCVAGPSAIISNPLEIPSSTTLPWIRTTSLFTTSTDPTGSLLLEQKTPYLYQQGIIGQNSTTLALVQHATDHLNAGVATATLGGSPTVGNVMFAIGGGHTSTAPSAASGWTLLAQSPGGSNSSAISYRVVQAGDSATQSGLSYPSGFGCGTYVSIFEVSGVDPLLSSLSLENVQATSWPCCTAGTLTLSHTSTHANDLALTAGGWATCPATSTLTLGGSTWINQQSLSNPEIISGTYSPTASGSSIVSTIGTGAGSSGMIVLSPIAPELFGYTPLSKLTIIQNAGTTVDTNPITLNFTAPLSVTVDTLGHDTISSSAPSISGTPTNGQVAMWTGASAIKGVTIGADCTVDTSGNFTCLKTNGTSFGTFATQNYATPPVIGGTTPNAGNFTTVSATGNITSNITGSTQCLHVTSGGIIAGTGTDCSTNGTGTISNTIVLYAGSNTPITYDIGVSVAALDSSTITIPASTVSRVFLVTGGFNYNATSTHGIYSFIDLDSTHQVGGVGWTLGGLAYAAGSFVSLGPVAITVPGDNASHTIAITGDDAGATGNLTYNSRWIQAIPQTISTSLSGPGLIGVQRFTTTGAFTYTPDVGTTSIIVELVGGGGGGAGVGTPGSTNWYLASGGGGGGWIRFRLSNNFIGATGSVGIAGAGGVAGLNPGSAGGATTFVTTNSITSQAGGGYGGMYQGPFGTFTFGPTSGNAGTSNIGGDDQVPAGSFGSSSWAYTLNNAWSGSGGWGPYSTGAPTNNRNGGGAGSQAGTAATGYGGGGSGAISYATGSSAAGGNGSQGEVIIWEYGNPRAIAAGAMQLIQSVVTSGSQTSVNFSSIPQTYSHLEAIVEGRSAAATGSDDILVQFNGDTGNNYATQDVKGQNTTAVGEENNAVSAFYTGPLPGSTSTANYSGAVKMTIPNYSSSIFFKNIIAYDGFASTTGASGQLAYTRFGQWSSTSAINSIKLTLSSAGGFVNGTIIDLYGIGGVAGSQTTAGTTSPQGRLTLTSNTPAPTVEVSAGTTIYYDSYIGQYYPYYNGTNDQLGIITGGQVSDALQSSGTGVVNNNDVFDEYIGVWGVPCHVTNGSGAGWSGDTGGSTTVRGSVYSALPDTSRGYFTNPNILTHCYNGVTDEGPIVAHQGLYLGSFYTTAAGTTKWVIRPAGTSGGGNPCACLFNAYNRGKISVRNYDNASVSYATNAWRMYHNSANDRITWVDGLGVLSGISRWQTSLTGSGFNSEWLIARNATTSGASPAACDTTWDSCIGFSASPGNTVLFSTYSVQALFGVQFIQVLEGNNGGGTFTTGTGNGSSLIMDIEG